MFDSKYIKYKNKKALIQFKRDDVICEETGILKSISILSEDFCRSITIAKIDENGIEMREPLYIYVSDIPEFKIYSDYTEETKHKMCLLFNHLSKKKELNKDMFFYISKFLTKDYEKINL